jgi:hypothetical protein
MNSINVITATPDSPAVLNDLDVSSAGDSDLLNNEGSMFSGVNITKVIAILTIILFLGYNISNYLADTSSSSGNFFNFVYNDTKRMFSTLFANPVKDTVITSEQGVKDIADLTTGTVTSGVDYVEKVVSPEKQQEKHENEYNSALSTLERTARSNMVESPVEADTSNSSIQTNRLDKGYCYVGTDRNYRTCVKVNERDQCMSGDIFPSRAICVNPSLRE